MKRREPRGAARLLALQLSQAFVVAAHETADASPADDQSLARGRGDCRQVDLAQINGRLRRSWGLNRRRGRNDHMQFVGPIPD